MTKFGKKRKQMSNSTFSDFIRNIPEGNNKIQYNPGYIKIISADGKNVYIYKKVDGVYKSCTFQKKPSRNFKTSKIKKTKKGKINLKYIPEIATLFALCLVIWNEANHLTLNSNEYQIEQQLPNPEKDLNIENNTIQIIIENENTIQSKIEKSQIPISPQLASSEIDTSLIQIIPFEIIQSEEMQSRKMTQELYGTIIEEYAQKYGLCPNLIEALITQERHKKILDNPGQLTREICGEEIIIPIIKKSEQEMQESKEVDKIYIVRDEPIRENFDNEQEYIKQLNRYKNQLEKSKELASKGYEIVHFVNLKGENNTHENIRISIIWLAHCIYKCDCQINKGVFAYNQGYPEARNANDKEIMNGLAGKTNADIWYNYNVFRFLTKEEATKMNFLLKPFPENWLYLSESEQKEYIDHLSQIPSQNITLSLPIFQENLEENYTYEKENGHSL